jgi:peptide/histidine transporter 3/4
LKITVEEVLENLAYLAKLMHFSPSSSANIINNYMVTDFLLALFGGFLAYAILPPSAPI